MMAREHHAIFGCFRFRQLMAENLFGDLPAVAQKSLSEITEIIHLEKGHVLIDKGDLFKVFILSKGKAAARYYNHLTKNQIQVPIRVGEIVGLVETISHSYSMLTIEATETSIFHKIERADLMRFLSEHPELSLKLLNELSLKLNESYEAFQT